MERRTGECNGSPIAGAPVTHAGAEPRAVAEEAESRATETVV